MKWHRGTAERKLKQLLHGTCVDVSSAVIGCLGKDVCKTVRLFLSFIKCLNLSGGKINSGPCLDLFIILYVGLESIKLCSLVFHILG